MMNNVFRSLIRISAFLRKEIAEIIRQPMLVLSLVLGPFLILLFFGLGYQNEARALRTLFVTAEDSPVTDRIREYAETLGPQLIFVGLTFDEAEAKARLNAGEVDIVTVVPADPFTSLLNNEQAVFILYHEEMDPLRANYVNIFGRVYVNEINRRVLRLITTRGQADLEQMQGTLDEAQASLEVLRRLLELCKDAFTQEGVVDSDCNTEAVREALRTFDRDVDEIEITAGDKTRLIDAVREGLDHDLGLSSETKAETETTLVDLIQNTNDLSDLEHTADDYLDKLRLVTQLETDLDVLEERLIEFLGIDPNILVTPFRAEAKSIAEVQLNSTDFFAPAVIALLLQHLTITFAALSMVRERQLGTMELFYVAPLSVLETLLGKYLSYLIFGSLIATILLILVVFGMNVPMLGHWWQVAVSLLALIFASLGMGFVISLLSKTDTQAVQYSMITLLTSVFFSGFILSLDTLWQPVQLISWLLPVTYGILLTRSIMLAGSPFMITTLLQLIIFGLALFIMAWFMLRRSMALVD